MPLLLGKYFQQFLVIIKLFIEIPIPKIPIEIKIIIYLGINNNIDNDENSKNKERIIAFFGPINFPIFNPKILNIFNNRSEHGIKK